MARELFIQYEFNGKKKKKKKYFKIILNKSIIAKNN